MTLADVLGQEPATQTLERALRGGHAHHAYRFEGPEGVGKTFTAFAFAQALLCEVDDSLGCGKCSACERAVTLRDGVPLHPDLILVGRGLYDAETLGRKTEEGKEISIDQVRKLVLSHSAYSPHEGRARVFIIKEADELSISAANALLKTLEEPRERTHFVLVTSRPNKLLVTIRSRSMPIRFVQLRDGVLAQLLGKRGVSDEKIAEIMPFAEGSLARAMDSIEDEMASDRNVFIGRVGEAIAAPSMALGIQLGESAEKNRLSLRAQVEGLARHFAIRARSEVNAERGKAERLAEAYEIAMRAATYLEGNASTSLTIIEMVADLKRARVPV